MSLGHTTSWGSFSHQVLFSHHTLTNNFKKKVDAPFEVELFCIFFFYKSLLVKIHLNGCWSLKLEPSTWAVGLVHKEAVRFSLVSEDVVEHNVLASSLKLYSERQQCFRLSKCTFVELPFSTSTLKRMKEVFWKWKSCHLCSPNPHAEPTHLHMS